MTTKRRARHPGIEVRHARNCAAARGGRCSCSPSYRAKVWSARDRRTIRKSFRSLAEAKAWRADAQVGLRRGTISAPRPITLAQAAGAWLAGARAGAIRNRSGDPYKPSAIRGYEQSLRLRLLPELGAMQVAEIRRADLQALVDRLLADDLSASTIRNTLLPVRVIFRRALVRGEVAVNPTAGLELPAVRSGGERIASPGEARRLLAALDHDRALWATAIYAGLRLGELRALEWDAVDLARGVIRVHRSWDPEEGPIEPKSRAGRRSVPLAAALRVHLAEHGLESGRRAGSCSGARLKCRSPRRPSTSALRGLGGGRALSRSRCTSAATPSPRS